MKRTVKTKIDEKQLEELVYNYKTVSKHGFLFSEIQKLVKEDLKDYEFNWDRFDEAMMGNTCMMYESKIVNYHCDVLTGLLCGLQNRGKYGYEFD